MIDILNVTNILSPSDVFRLIYMTLISVGIILSIVIFFMSPSSSINVSISSYSTMILGFLFLAGNIIEITNKSSLSMNISIIQRLLNIISNMIPIILILFILSYSLYLIIFFKNKIENNQVSTSYSTFSKLSVLFIVMQTIIIFYGIYKQNTIKENGGVIPKIYTSFSSLFSIINICILMIMDTILRYFSTDGFMNHV